jgi:hypothetical protein
MVNKNFINYIYYLAIVTISFDVILNFNLGPNVRFSQLLFIFFIFYAFYYKLNHKILLPIGFIYLLIWSSFIFIFIPNSGFIEKGAGYFLWLILNVLLIFFTNLYYSQSLSLINMIKFYIISFMYIAFFGVMQFIFGIFGYGELLLVQTWWIPDVLPRLNGFSYEPSFYATYLMLGWVSIGYMLRNKIYLFSKFILFISYVIITLALILSGSRLGYVFMAIWGLIKIFDLLFFNAKKINYFILILAQLGGVLVFLTILFINFSESDIFKTLAFGTGLGETSSHSIDERFSGAYDLIKIFFDSPFVGYSLGGLSYALGNLRGIVVDDFISAKLEGNGVFLEVLAASGIVGFIPFLFYILAITVRPFTLNYSSDFLYSAKLLHGMTWALIFELLMLQANQNILRPYLWLHISIVCVLYSGIVLKNPSLANKSYDRH